MSFTGFFNEKNQVHKTKAISRQIASISPVFVSLWCSCYPYTDDKNFNRFQIRKNSFWANWIWPIFAAAARPSPCISPWGPLNPAMWPILPRYRGSLGHLPLEVALLFFLLHLSFLSNCRCFYTKKSRDNGESRYAKIFVLRVAV